MVLASDTEMVTNQAMQNRIRELRLARNLKLDEVAANVGTTPQQLSRLERGTRRLTDDWMWRIARALYVQPADLFVGKPHLRPDNHELIEHPEELRVIRFWRLLSPEEKRMIAAFARDKGLDILAARAKKHLA